jgi:histidinol-phosphatase
MCLIFGSRNRIVRNVVRNRIVNKSLTKTPSEWLVFLNHCADIAGPIALHYFNTSLRLTKKPDQSIVTQGDLDIETAIRAHIEKEVPGIDILGEEFGGGTTESPGGLPVRLIIDPIDATSNFYRKIPIFATLLAIEVNQKIVAGVVYNPATDERWTAAKGQGATLNGSKITVSKVNDITESQAFHGGLFGREARGELDQLLAVLKLTKRQRGLGDFLIHMYVAQGVGEFAIDFRLKPWDLAPLGIIIEEAGGKVTTVTGDPFSPYTGSILASNGQFHDQLIQLYNSQA